MTTIDGGPLHGRTFPHDGTYLNVVIPDWTPWFPHATHYRIPVRDGIARWDDRTEVDRQPLRTYGPMP